MLLNVVTGGDDSEQRRFGDHLSKEASLRPRRGVPGHRRALWAGEPVDFAGEHYRIADARDRARPVWPELYFGGSSAAAIEVAAAAADVYLTWGEPPAAVADKLDRA